MKLKLAILLLASLISAGFAGCGTDGEGGAPAAQIEWEGSMRAAKEAATAAGKPIAAFFYVDWAEDTASSKFRQEVLGAPAVRKLAGEFVWAEFDGLEEKAVTGKFKVHSFPTLLVIEADDTEIDRIDRFYDAEETAAFLKDCLEKR